MTADTNSISMLEQSTAPSTPEAPYNGYAVAGDEINRSAVQTNGELNYRVLSTPIEFSPSVGCSPLDVREVSTIKTPSEPENLGYEQSTNATNSEEKKQGGAERAHTPSLPSIISTQFESNGDVELLEALPHLHQDLLGEGNLVLRKQIEESDAELIGEKASPEDENIELGMSAAIARAPMRGRGLPEIKLKPNVRFAPSDITDITDLGNHMHDLKTQGRIMPSGLLISQTDPKEPLQDRLIDILQETPGYPEKKGFFPRDRLATLVDEECVIEQLGLDFKNVLDDDTIRNFAQKICGVALVRNEEGMPPLFKKIFVTLVLSEKTSTILKFLAEKVTDDDLPLAKVGRPGKKLGIFDLGRRGKPNVPLECFRGWTACAIRRFEEWQWTTISPFFARSRGRKNVKHFPLQDQVILPFISDSRREAGAYERLEFEGGFSQVFKVDIHQEHHDFHDPHVANHSFAIKCLLSRNREDFDREVEILKKFSGDSHVHLVSLLSTYEQFKKFYLVFQWAEADLLDYWKVLNPTPSVNLKTILWMAQQCKGIANGLSKIHHYESSSSKAHPNLERIFNGSPRQNLVIPTSHAPVNAMEQLYGRHGDIKPVNVLLFRNSEEHDNIGTLKLTDFGLAEFSALHSKSYKPKSKVATSPSYRPPECDLQDGTIGRSYDIWTLGCLYLEFITWLLGGWDLVQEFTQKRMSFDPMWHEMLTDTFFEIVKCSVTGTPGAMIKPAVTDFIFELHAHRSCTEYLHQFLNLIEEDMMIVKPNDANIRGRLNCEEVDRKLLEMLRNCKADEDYASKPAPRSKSGMEHNPTPQKAFEADVANPAVKALLRKELRIHSGETQRIFVPAAPKRPVE